MPWVTSHKSLNVEKNIQDNIVVVYSDAITTHQFSVHEVFESLPFNGTQSSQYPILD